MARDYGGAGPGRHLEHPELDFEPLLADGVTEFLGPSGAAQDRRRHRHRRGIRWLYAQGPDATPALEPPAGRLFAERGKARPPFQQR